MLDGVPAPAPDEARFWGRTPSQNVHLQIAVKLPALCCHLANTNEQWWACHSDSAFCQMTLVIVYTTLDCLLCCLCWFRTSCRNVLPS